MNKRQAIITVTTVIVASLFIILSTGCVPPNIHVHPGGGGGGGGGGGAAMEANTNRPGMDIAAGHTVANAGVCKAHCDSNSSCRSWTYVKGNHKCWLKHGVPVGQHNNCCTSGVKTWGGGSGNANIVNNRNRPGMDMGPGYTVANAGVCRAHCNSNPSCRAYTYVKGNHKCWLKHGKPAAQVNSCCISGAKP